MEDETRAAIESLISERRRARFEKTRTYAYDLGSTSSAKTFTPADYTSYEKIRAKAKSAIGTKPTPTYSFHQAEAGVNLKEQVATLSVDTASASIVLKAPLNPDTITRIERAVPFTQREWLSAVRAWRFAPAALPMLKPILKDVYKDVQMLGVPKALPSTKFDQLMSKLSAEDKATIYKLLASKYHPDKGGPHEVMTLINLVFRR